MKKALGPDEKRELVDHAKEEHGISNRQALKMFSLRPSVYYYKPKPSQDQQVKEELSQLSKSHRRWGFWRMHHH